MKNIPNVVIVTGRCSKSKQGIGLRYQEMSPNYWVATWAFTLNEKLAQREGYAKQEIAGELDFGEEYPGCPHCEARSCVKCDCGNLGCWDGTSVLYTCPHCSSKGKVSGNAESLDAGGDR